MSFADAGRSFPRRQDGRKSDILNRFSFVLCAFAITVACGELSHVWSSCFRTSASPLYRSDFSWARLTSVEKQRHDGRDFDERVELAQAPAFMRSVCGVACAAGPGELEALSLRCE